MKKIWIEEMKYKLSLVIAILHVAIAVTVMTGGVYVALHFIIKYW